MALTSNTYGPMCALTVLTPIIPGYEDKLRGCLEGFRDTGSPLAKLPRTHFGRWVIVPSFLKDPTEPKEGDLDCSYLLFSSTFDGPLDSYVDELCSQLAREAERIWGCCIGCPESAGRPGLKAYLLHNQIETGLFFSAYPTASLETVKESLHTREQTIAFAARTQGMEPAALRKAFLEELGS